MKTGNKFGGKRYAQLVCGALFIGTVFSHCISQQSSVEIEKTLPQLNAKENFEDLKAAFTIPKDTIINIKSFGEGVDYSINKEMIRSYDNDCIEVFFDLKNEKKASFDATGDDRQYRIVWKFLRIDGINADLKNVKVAQTDPDEKSYVMEISFPWKTLGHLVPAEHKKIGFDIAIDDNDKETRKGMLAWNSTVDDAWRNTAIYGTLLLSKRKEPVNENQAVSLVAKKAPVIDGIADPIWGDVPKYYFKKVMTGYVDNDEDLSGYYRSMWDKENLYLLVNVRDNIKNYAQAMFDYGWIENKQGSVVWKMEMNKTRHAGGALKNRHCDTNIFIKKGEYVLHYITDESHSPKSWDAAKPRAPFYGIHLSYKK